MTDFTLPPLQPARIDWRGDTPFAGDYGDSYFMPGRGAAESRAVFVEASDLPQRFAELPADGVFVIGEAGFGTGLNALLAAAAFERHAPATARLHYFSAELHPLSRGDLAVAVSHWPELRQPADRMLDAWPPPAPGFHRIALGAQVELTLMLGDAATLWAAGPGGVDAWFLDGFAPSRNPAMWSQSLLAALAERSRAGATVATYSAAGSVRRALAAAGFEVERHAGFGGKRHRLSARMPGAWTPRRARRGSATVVGAGFAGCTTARALAERGWSVTVVDPALANGPPAALAAVLYATASHRLNAQNRFYLGALLHARAWLRRLGFPRRAEDGRLDGVIQHLVDPRVREKTRRAVGSRSWPRELLESHGEDRVRIAGAGCLRPRPWCRFLLDHPAISTSTARVTSIAGGASARVVLESGETIESDALVLCTAGATREFNRLDWLPLRVVRGQVTLCRATPASRRWREVHCHAGYITPAIDDIHCLGATFDRQRPAPFIDPGDDERNLAELRQHLPAMWRALGGDDVEVVGRHAGVRCQAPDALPLVGPCPDPAANPHTLDERVWLNIAHGSKGLTHTPLCADVIADGLSGHPTATDGEVLAALAPERFVERKRRREPDWLPER